jgi:hypothetical protein
MQIDLSNMTPLQFDRLLRHEVARRHVQGMSAAAIANELTMLPEMVALVLSVPAPLRKCRP